MNAYINGTLNAIRDGNRAYKNKVINFVYSFAPGDLRMLIMELIKCLVL